MNAKKSAPSGSAIAFFLSAIGALALVSSSLFLAFGLLEGGQERGISFILFGAAFILGAFYMGIGKIVELLGALVDRKKE